MSCNRKASIVLFAVLVSFSLLACHHNHQTAIEMPPASVHLLASSVTSWEDYVRELQPSFALSEKEALAQSVPTTLVNESDIYDSFRSALALKFAKSYDLPGGFGEGDTAGSNLPGSTLDEPQKRTTTSAFTDEDKKLGLDPYLQYWAAASLYQEVKLINRYLRDLNYDPKRYKPYIVQLLLNQVPHSRNASFDTYVTISFFNQPVPQPYQDGGLALIERNMDVMGEKSRARSREIHLELEKISQNIGTLLKYDFRGIISGQDLQNYNRLYAKTKSKIQALEEMEGVAGEDIEKLLEVMEVLSLDILLSQNSTPLVMPMLVTDQVEEALLARRSERLREYALTLAAAFAGIGGQASFEKMRNEIDNSLGSSISSRYTIGRLNDNTVRVNLSARRTADALTYEAEKRNHRISLLVLVPKELEDRHVYFASKTWFVNPLDGKLIMAKKRDKASLSLQEALIPVCEIEKKCWLKGSAAGASEKRSAAKSHPLFRREMLLAFGIVLASEMQNKDLTEILSVDDRTALIYMVQNNQHNAFLARLTDKFKPTRESKEKFIGLANSLWMELSEAAIGSQYATGSFYIKKEPLAFLGWGSHSIMLDDKKTATTLIAGVKNISPEKIIARWSWPKTGTEEVALVPNNISLSVNGKFLKLSYDSPKFMGLNPTHNSTIDLNYEGDAKGERQLKVVYRDISKKPGKKSLGFSLVQDTVSAGRDVQIGLNITELDGITGYQEKCRAADIDKKEIENCIIMTLDDAALRPEPNSSIMKRITHRKYQGGRAYAIFAAGTVDLTAAQLTGTTPLVMKFKEPEGYAPIAPLEIKVVPAN